MFKLVTRASKFSEYAHIESHEAQAKDGQDRLERSDAIYPA